jgi:hypothetical protein
MQPTAADNEIEKRRRRRRRQELGTGEWVLKRMPKVNGSWNNTTTGMWFAGSF